MNECERVTDNRYIDIDKICIVRGNFNTDICLRNRKRQETFLATILNANISNVFHITTIKKEYRK